MMGRDTDDKCLPEIMKLLRWLFPATMLIALYPSRAQQQAPSAANDPAKDSVIATTTDTKPQIEMPPSQPEVSCNGHQLAIKANNATLASVLNAVGTCLGTKIDVPEGAAGERMYVQSGPGPTREILTLLLSSTDFNYVIRASQADPEKIETVLILQRTEGTPTIPEPVPTRARRVWLENQRQAETMRQAREEAAQGSTEPAESPDVASAAQAENTAPDQTPVAESSIAASSSSATANPSSPVSSPTQGKSTQDMISNMQQLFEQRRQMVANQKASQQQ